MKNLKELFVTLLSFVTLLLLSNNLNASTNEARLLRFPNIKGDKIVFSYAGDLYLTSSNGGVARKITSSAGYEMFAKFSPDGKMIAFTAQYDGNSEVYLISSEGGEPKRLTYTATLERDDVGDRMGPNNIVMGWTPDGKYILYRTRAFTFNDFTGQLMMVPVEGGLSKKVPLKNGGFASFSPDGKKLAYNYIFREFRAWKRYEGGMADDIRVFDLESKESRKITDNPNQDLFPMWSPDGQSLFYASDRDSHMNLYRFDFKNNQTTQLTNYTEYDVKFPSYGDNYIVYENGGYIYKLNMESGKSEKLSIYINNDAAWARPQWKNLSTSIKELSISPNGERIIASARGNLFSIAAKEGITYDLTKGVSANEKMPMWSPDGNGYAYVSDKDGEFNIWYVDAAGKEKRLTNLKTHILGMEWSPDAKKIAWCDKQNSLNILDVASGKSREIERSGRGPINDFNWSPDSKMLLYTRAQKEVSIVMLYNLESQKKIEITDNWYNSSGANFSSDGKYILFSSARTFNPTYGQTEWNHVYTNMNKIYLLPIAKGAVNPFAPKNDTVSLLSSVAEKGAKESKESKEGKSSSASSIEYDFENLSSKVIELPVAAGFYRNLHMVGKSIYYSGRGGTTLLDLESKKETELKANIIFGPGYKKALAIVGKAMQVIDLPRGPITLNAPINLNGVKKLVDFDQEWMQIYNESWRQMRDYFYAKNMHGVNWDKVQKRYGDLVPYVKHRSDLTYLIGEMIAELNVGHAYSQNGEHPFVAPVKMGLLGAEFSRDKSGYFRVEKIIEGVNWNAKTRSPLTMPGVEVKEGEYLISINGNSLTQTNDLYQYLVGCANSVVEIEVNSKPQSEGARKVLVEPIADESALRYYNWVQSNIKKVSEATDGQVGYIHIPDMGPDGLNEFVKHYYPQLTKKALIIDDRGNGGGNVSPMIIERLQRTITYFSMHTNQTEGDLNPVGTFQGPKVLLINEYSASDGDLFPYRFRHNKLGTIIGRRSWGGVVGYSGTVPVVDGGSIVTPSYAPFAADGSGWIIEGSGVAPDIDIFNDPYKEFMGVDEQLEKAIEVAKEQIKSYKYLPATIPSFPNKAPKR